jgi:hypothetical protein
MKTTEQAESINQLFKSFRSQPDYLHENISRRRIRKVTRWQRSNWAKANERFLILPRTKALGKEIRRSVKDIT